MNASVHLYHHSHGLKTALSSWLALLSLTFFSAQAASLKTDMPYRTKDQPGVDAYAAERCQLDVYVPEGDQLSESNDGCYGIPSF